MVCNVVGLDNEKGLFLLKDVKRSENMREKRQIGEVKVHMI